MLKNKIVTLKGLTISIMMTTVQVVAMEGGKEGHWEDSNRISSLSDLLVDNISTSHPREEEKGTAEQQRLRMMIDEGMSHVRSLQNRGLTYGELVKILDTIILHYKSLKDVAEAEDGLCPVDVEKEEITRPGDWYVGYPGNYGDQSRENY